MKETAVLSLGSNLGDRKATIKTAIKSIASLKGVKLLATSSLYESTALTESGFDPEQPSYINAAITIETSLKPKALLAALNEIENDNGRIRLQRWAPRTLDLDIITYGHELIETKTLIVPHPRAHERSFVLAPWLELEPDAVLPGRGRVDVLLQDLENDLAVVK